MLKEFYSNMSNVVPKVGDYVMLNVDALPMSTKGSLRNRWIHIMEVQDAERVWRIVNMYQEDITGDTMYVLAGAHFHYKAEELILIGYADGRNPNVQEEEKT